MADHYQFRNNISRLIRLARTQMEIAADWYVETMTISTDDGEFSLPYFMSINWFAIL